MSEGFAWTAKRSRAAQLVAEDRIPDLAIAAQVGVTERQLERWKKVPEFRARVASIVERTREALFAKGITEKQNRIDALNDQFGRLRRVIVARATDPATVGIPGGSEGLLVAEPMLIKVYRATSNGADPDDETLAPTRETVILHKYGVDVGLLKEMRETMKQAAIELGEWTEKQDVTSGGQQVSFTLKLSNDDLRVHPPESVSEAE